MLLLNIQDKSWVLQLFYSNLTLFSSLRVEHGIQFGGLKRDGHTKQEIKRK